jgi:DNA replication and repair protein RecF
VYLQTLALTDYRNYDELRLTLGQGRFVLAGDNAQGKSNLCEAIRMLATMRSFRAASDRELVRWGATGHFARVASTIERAAGPLELEIIISAPPTPDDPLAQPLPTLTDVPVPAKLATAGKRIRVNSAAKRALDCVGLVTVVLFEPTDLDLVIGPPSGRRHFMDVTLCQISRSYCRALSQYQRVITQRAALLKRIRDNQDDPRALAYWDVQMAELAAPIISERAGLIARCTPPADEVARRLGGQGLVLAYQPSFPVALDASAATITAAFVEKLASLRRREIAQGVNLLGPHRDDLAFFAGPVNLATYGSRGQQRVAALALKLAELEAIEIETGDQPILVLDDVLSELDPTRREALLASVAAISQVILTTAEPAALPATFVANAQVLAVKAGTVSA